MTFRIELAPAARRALTHSLPEAVAAACANFLHDVLAQDPYRCGKPLRDELAGRLLSAHAHGNRLQPPVREVTGERMENATGEMARPS